MAEHTNEGKFRVYHEGITGLEVKSGYVNIEVDPLTAIQRVKDTPCIYLSNGTSVTYNEIIYINGYPKDCMKYSEVKQGYYYWNTVHKLLYTKNKGSQEPWIVLDVEIVYVAGKPSEIITNPEEGVLYCDNSLSSRELQLYKWTAKGGWEEYKIMVQLIMSPKALGYDPETTDYSKLYLDMSHNVLYQLDPFVFLVDVSFTSALKNGDKYLIYERPFAYFDGLNTKSFDVNNEIRVDFKDIIFISKDPNEYVSNPDADRYYRNALENKWYKYDGVQFNEIRDKIIAEFGEPIYVKGVPSEIVVETPKTDRPYVNIMSGKIYMFQDNAWVYVGTSELSLYHPCKDFY